MSASADFFSDSVGTVVGDNRPSDVGKVAAEDRVVGDVVVVEFGDCRGGLFPNCRFGGRRFSSGGIFGISSRTADFEDPESPRRV